ncbi:uncharacterized protein LOC107982055 [Nasonia vitripennis]|uniref:Mab-21-like HhH/H2TH-like domain-containing protein n=1 Tax=Nasonia vitripennis TaxID=7425 RepID=A0A7M7M7Y1_NASVI|nr:uncharacterized protein LOC107982055 [Nasonia vitripennis]
MPGNVAESKHHQSMGNVNGATKVKFGGSSKISVPWRKRHKNPDKSEESIAQDGPEEGGFAEAEDDAERDQLWRMSKMIRDEPDVFVMNNLLLSIQLFSNYEKEMKKAHQEVLTREEELNEKLLPEKRALLPDALREHFAGRLRFTSFCKSDEDEQTVEPLRPIKVYLVYENVVVSELDEARHYSSPGDLNYNYTFLLKKAKYEGYARLEQISQPSLKRGPDSDNTDLSSIAENTDEIYSEGGSVYGLVSNSQMQNAAAGVSGVKTKSMPNLLDEGLYYDEQNNSGLTHELQSNGKVHRQSRPHRNARPRLSNQTNPSSTSSSSSGYLTNGGYGFGGADSDSSESLHHLQQSRFGRNAAACIDPSSIPSHCFSRVTYMYNGRIYNPTREPKALTIQQRRIRNEKLRHNYKIVYVNADEFSKHFDRLFRHDLAARMDFDKKTVESATKSDATIKLEKIFYDTIKKYTSIEQYEVIPCFSSPWPRWARKWSERTRGDWPNQEDIRRVEKFPCYLIPESFRPLGANSETGLWKLDWNLSFPGAERYLETCLSPPQMTVYTIALMMHKTFMRNLSSSFGLNASHIRNMVFQMIEKMPDWSEHEMGKLMKALLEKLHYKIQQRKLCDYFLEERNLFANINTDYLLHSQKQLNRIIENPVMFLFHAMEKIHYEDERQYPRLNYRELLRLLTINEILIINPNLEAKNNEDQQQQEDTGVGFTAVYGKKEADKKFWSEVKETNQYHMQTRKRNMKTLITPKQVVDSIIDIREKCEPLTTVRLASLLIFFAKHFIRMADSCTTKGAAHQKKVYLNQARLLGLLLLHESPDHKSEARKILDEVRSQRGSPVQTPDLPAQPITPRRNADEPLYAGTLRDRFNIASSIQAEVHSSETAEQSDAKSALYKSSSSKVATTKLAKKLMNNVTLADKPSAETTSF